MPSSAKRASSLRPSPERPPSSAAPSANGLRLFQVSPAIRRPSSQKRSAVAISYPNGSTPSRASISPIRSPRSTASRSACVRTVRTRSGFSRTAWWSAVTWRSASRRLPSGWSSSSMKTGQTCRPTPPASSSGSHVCANTFVSPSRCSRYASSSSRSVWASASNLRTILSAMTAVASTQTFSVTNPATGEVIAEVPRHGVEETRRAIAAAERAYPAWRARPAKERAQILRRCADLMLERQEELARLLTTEQGKPLAGGASRDRLRGLVLRVVRRGGEAGLRRHDPRATRPTGGSSCSRSRSASPPGSRPGTSPRR